jgi:hypothetical protein
MGCLNCMDFHYVGNNPELLMIRPWKQALKAQFMIVKFKSFWQFVNWFRSFNIQSDQMVPQTGRQLNRLTQKKGMVLKY